jgi:hypothetical protein
MPPLPITALVARGTPTKSAFSVDGDVVEAWADGFNVGALIILILIVFCNIKSGVWLHKLILLEVCFRFMYSPLSVFDAKVVVTGNLAWYLHLLSRSSIWLVSTAMLVPGGSI